jgi:hypothetical protein
MQGSEIVPKESLRGLFTIAHLQLSASGAHHCPKRKGQPLDEAAPLDSTDESAYTATSELWKVEVTASNVCTFGVPSIIFANVRNTSG